MSSSSRATALASAATASARVAQTYPKAAPVPRSSLRPQQGSQKGKERAWEERRGGTNDDQADGADLSSQQRRLSRAARFGSSYSAAPITIPERWSSIVEGMVDKANKQALRLDYLALQRAGRSSVKDARRLSILHLTAGSPSRFAGIQSVLRQVRSRLGPDEEQLGSDANAWTPSRIVEYGCGAGEGLWAAVDAFGSMPMDGRGVASYAGCDTRQNLVRTANGIIDTARHPPPVNDEHGDGQEGASVTADEDEKPLEHEKSPLEGIHISLKVHFNSDELATKEHNVAAPLPSSNRDTLILCSYALSSLDHDKARGKFVSSLWKEHPSAEVIVFIEEATERGFASIASARECLLGIDEQSAAEKGGLSLGRNVFYDEAELAQEGKSAPLPNDGMPECHVVAPCPHDRACPLLHDFEFLEPPSVMTNRTSTSSPLFHGASLGMGICSFPNRMHRPAYLKKTTHEVRPDESGRYSYVVVRRGPRPSVHRHARSMSPNEEEVAAQTTALRRGAERTKKGDIEAIRAGSKPNAPILAEEMDVNDEAGSATMNAEEMDEPLAREELLKLLPQALKSEMESTGEEQGPDMDEAIRLAHEMLQKSAGVAGTHSESDQGSTEEAPGEDTLLAASFLDQAQQLRRGDQASGEGEGETALLAGDIDAMRIEAYQWPRLIKPALKKSGHVTFDVCSSSGSIDRFTLSKSSGKQVFQDARKSSQGDIFPHVPFSDEEGVPAMMKSLVVRVPAASSQRGSLAASFRPAQSPIKQEAGPVSSSAAIGPDRVLGRRVNREADSERHGRVLQSRRQHYQGEDKNQRRDTRKRSMGYYDRAIQEAWRD